MRMLLCIYVYIERERERERDVIVIRLCRLILLDLGLSFRLLERWRHSAFFGQSDGISLYIYI